MDGKECLRTFSSYLCFSRLKLYSCYITKFDQVRFEPLCVRSTWSPRFVMDLNFQNFFVIFGPTDSSISVIQRSLSRSRFSISVQPIWTFRSHRVAVTVNSYASRCHWVIPLGHTNGVGLYIHTGKNLESFLQTSSPAHSSLCLLGLRIIDFVASRLLSLVSATVNGFHLRRCRRSEFIAELGYELDHSAILVWFSAHCVHYDSCHDWNTSIQ